MPNSCSAGWISKMKVFHAALVLGLVAATLLVDTVTAKKCAPKANLDTANFGAIPYPDTNGGLCQSSADCRVPEFPICSEFGYCNSQATIDNFNAQRASLVQA
ncbi:hypothetical protein H4R33_000796 [Dimargaris cristalligena]|uniref:CBM1 domain-containing protein n=1 Tax=Dimargaris cristalligena TaxID=215637 RepID=A0A4P9ZS38_9FUNG|nr:hypothetical protein H4R33_000796 [Dimargaris cristalligena]RKP35601.1 hypothetical protein BJ085DRAFT_34049 [Dimargaris cristalligena]|eukprot:RKP35601.1 hypothetical protein BJ085DRAFT_34049 [Dimargaris cristalligena]